MPRKADVKHAFIGADAEGDPCIFIGRLEANGDFDGDYLSTDELKGICEQLNQQKGWSNSDA